MTENLRKILEVLADNPAAQAVQNLPPTPFDPATWGEPRHKKDGTADPPRPLPNATEGESSD